MSTLLETLNRIDVWFEQYQPEYARSFYLGLKHQIIAEELELFTPITDEIFELYSWRNGWFEKSRRFIASYAFDLMPLEEAKNEAIFLSNQSEPEYRYKGKLLFPFTTSDIGYHCVVIGQKESPVVFFGHESSSDEIVYDSVTTMMKSFALNLESGAYYVKQEGEFKGFIVEDEDKVARTLCIENPNTIKVIIQELENLETLSKEDMDEAMAYGKTDGVFYAARRYRDKKFVPPLQNLLVKNNYYKNSLLEVKIFKTLEKIK